MASQSVFLTLFLKMRNTRNKLPERRQHSFKHYPYPAFSLCSPSVPTRVIFLLPCLYLFILSGQVSVIRIAAEVSARGVIYRAHAHQRHPLKKTSFPPLTGQRSELRKQWCLVSPSPLATIVFLEGLGRVFTGPSSFSWPSP